MHGRLDLSLLRLPRPKENLNMSKYEFDIDICPVFKLKIDNWKKVPIHRAVIIHTLYIDKFV